ncbi:MAG: hypothetical protein WD926_00075 [Patescibacteria group bacterium]
MHQSTSSPKRKPGSPKRKRPESLIRRRLRPGIRRIGKAAAVLAAVAGLLATIGVVTWFATAGWRADKAQAYDAESRALLARQDVDGSYQQARLAYAISPEPDRALSLGSLAYVRGDYRRALGHFAAAEGPFGALGGAAAGAQVDVKAYESARDELGEPDDTVVRLGLSHAAIDAADFGTAKRLSEGARTIVGAYPFILAESVGDPDRTAQELRALRTDVPRVIHPDPAVAAFLNKLTAVPGTAREKIAGSLRNMALAERGFSRRVMRGSLLFELDERAAALRIGTTASEQQPDYRDAWNLRGAADLYYGNYDGARRAFDISLDLDSSFGYSWYLKSKLEKAEGNDSRAAEYLRRAELLGFKPAG